MDMSFFLLTLLVFPPKLELENAIAQASTQQQRSKAELQEAQRIIAEITAERDDLLAKIELLNTVSEKQSRGNCTLPIEYIKMIAC